MQSETYRNQFSHRFFGSIRWIAGLTLLLSLAVAAIAAENRPVRSRVAPAYPELARRLKITGQVTVEITIDPAGNVTDAKAKDGNRMLTAAAEEAVRRWRFAPSEGSSSQVVVVEFTAAN